MPLIKKSPSRKKVIAKQEKAVAATTNDAPKSTPTGETSTYQGYCVKCKEKGVTFVGEVFVNKSGSKIAKGPHTACGTTVCRILGKNA